MKFQSNLTKSAVTSVVAMLLLLGGAASANAATPSPVTANGEQTLRTTVTNDSCLTQVGALRSSGVTNVSSDICTSTVVAHASAESTVTASDLARAKQSMSPSEYSSLAAAVATTTVHSKAYSQTISQITDQERQFGTFYYDGSRAWVTANYLGYTGTHFCVADYSVGYTVSNSSCIDSGTVAQRDLTMIWNFALPVKNSPVAWSEVYTLHVNVAGAIWQ